MHSNVLNLHELLHRVSRSEIVLLYTHGGGGDGLLHTALMPSYAAELYLAKNL